MFLSCEVSHTNSFWKVNLFWFYKEGPANFNLAIDLWTFTISISESELTFLRIQKAYELTHVQILMHVQTQQWLKTIQQSTGLL